MNKRVKLIFLPVLVILFSLVCKVNLAVPDARIVNSLSVSPQGTQAHYQFPPTQDLKKDHKHKIYAPMRIKAWDGFVAINFSPTEVPVPAILYFPETIIYGGYRVNEVSAQFSAYGRRGPPTA